MRFILSFVLVIAFYLIQPRAVFAAESSDKRNQLEELFIWKLSDELKLSPVEEKKFTDIVKNLNKKKADLNHSLSEAIDKMKQASSTK